MKTTSLGKSTILCTYQPKLSLVYTIQMKQFIWVNTIIYILELKEILIFKTEDFHRSNSSRHKGVLLYKLNPSHLINCVVLYLGIHIVIIIIIWNKLVYILKRPISSYYIKNFMMKCSRHKWQQLAYSNAAGTILEPNLYNWNLYTTYTTEYYFSLLKALRCKNNFMPGK